RLGSPSSPPPTPTTVSGSHGFEPNAPPWPPQSPTSPDVSTTPAGTPPASGASSRISTPAAAATPTRLRAGPPAGSRWPRPATTKPIGSERRLASVGAHGAPTNARSRRGPPNSPTPGATGQPLPAR